MANGNLALVLHAHLPYVRSAEHGSLEEDWYFQAVLECYLPLLELLESSAREPSLEPKLTISLSPTLLALLEDRELNERFPKWLKLRLELLSKTNKNYKKSSEYLETNFQKQLTNWHSCDGDLISRFSTLYKNENIDILTCAATHGYLPLLRETPESIRGQLRTAVREHYRTFGFYPQGIWLPECAYFEGLDKHLIDVNLRYTVLDGHGILHSTPRPRYGVYAPICSKNGVAFFGRDSDSTLPVWSSSKGFPGNSHYREFHRDLGWDLPEEKLKSIGVKSQRPLGIKLHKITGKKKSLDQKQEYEPLLAKKQVKKDAISYLEQRKSQLEKLKKAMSITPILVAPFDAELFGHWWFEGPEFIHELFKLASSFDIKFITLKEVLRTDQKLQLCEPCQSSWGQGGYHNYWVNQTNSWVVNEWINAGKAMAEVCTNNISKESDIRILQQAARELLLLQSSDWSFILKAGTTIDIAKERINIHRKRFWYLIDIIKNKKGIKEPIVQEIENEDPIFPLIYAKDWYSI